MTSCFLSGPDRKSTIHDDVLSQLLNEELEAEVMFAQRLSASPPQALPLTHSLTPLRKAHRAPTSEDAPPLKLSIVPLNRTSPSEVNSPPSPAGDESIRSESTLSFTVTSSCAPFRSTHECLQRFAAN